MSIRTISVFAALLTSLAVPASSANAASYTFKPFTDLNTVCPKCEPQPADVLTLKDGKTVRGKVIAMNSAFYTVRRYGEVRTVPKADVTNVAWQNGSQPVGIDTLDQIVLKNGHVLTGSIAKEDTRARVLKSATPEQTFIVAFSETAAVFKRGVESK